MSVVAGLGIVLIVGFVGVALVACIAWRKRMRESTPYGDWRQAAQPDAAPSSEWNKGFPCGREASGDYQRGLFIPTVVFGAARAAADTTAQNYPERS